MIYEWRSGRLSITERTDGKAPKIPSDSSPESAAAAVERKLAASSVPLLGRFIRKTRMLLSSLIDQVITSSRGNFNAGLMFLFGLTLLFLPWRILFFPVTAALGYHLRLWLETVNAQRIDRELAQLQPLREKVALFLDVASGNKGLAMFIAGLMGHLTVFRMPGFMFWFIFDLILNSVPFNFMFFFTGTMPLSSEENVMIGGIFTLAIGALLLFLRVATFAWRLTTSMISWYLNLDPVWLVLLTIAQLGALLACRKVCKR